VLGNLVASPLKRLGPFDLNSVLGSNFDQSREIRPGFLELFGGFPEEPVQPTGRANHGIFSGVSVDDFEIVAFSPWQEHHITRVTSDGSIVLINLENAFMDDEGLVFPGMSVRRRSVAGHTNCRHHTNGIARLVRSDYHIAFVEGFHDSVWALTRNFPCQEVVGIDHKLVESNPGAGLA